MENNVYFVKSLEEDFYTKTLKEKKKVNFQSVEDMIEKKIIRPNTKSFGKKSRLSTTILGENYVRTYRPQGIIFQTNIAPSYVVPFDLVVLSDAKKIIVHYYRIKNNLHVYYNHELIPGFEQFIFKNMRELLQRFPSHSLVWDEVNRFRENAGFSKLAPSKHRLIEYNEAVFEKGVSITPVAIFGYRKRSRIIAKEYQLPHYRSAKDFYEKVILRKANDKNKKKKEDTRGNNR